MTEPLRERPAIEWVVGKALWEQPVIDMHTHLYPPSFGTPDQGRDFGTDPNGMLLWGIDELLTYHYLVAEVFRVVPATELSYEDFWKMTKSQQAEHIWHHLFIERSPVSEACRGVLNSLRQLGLDTSHRNLNTYRQWFSEQNPSEYIDRVMETSNVCSITMTNAVFDDNERERWLANPDVGADSRFTGVLRIDPILRDWPTAAKKLNEWGYDTREEMTHQTIEEARRFLRDWIKRVNAIYVAVSLPPDFRYPVPAGASAADVAGQKALEEIVLPVCEELGLPFAMMVGSRLQVNPSLGDAGDMVGKSDVVSVVNLCHGFPNNKFFCTMLARENQHELCVATRKFGNLMLFGCWWFLNNPSLIEEMTRMRLELLGTTMIPQHSDARVLDQLTYKWEHTRHVLLKVFTDKYVDLANTGWLVNEDEIRRDVRDMLHDNFKKFLTR